MTNVIKTIEDYSRLDPDTVINAVESKGYLSDARVLALNSYENRVYQVGIEDEQPIIAKFYRPGRWSDKQILEEHTFSNDLFERDIPAIPPLYLSIKNESSSPEKASLFTYKGYRFALYKRRGGRAPELTDMDQLYWLGKLMGRIHAIGKTGQFQHRPTLSIESFISRPSRYILEHDFMPSLFRESYEAIVKDILQHVKTNYQQFPPELIRLHGDCHPGNILWTDNGPHFVDFDDSRNGPAVQDLWMLLSGERNEQEMQLREILEGYEEFCDFNLTELNLIESLRSMRIIHYAGWLAKRWQDPAFPRAFPWFNSEQFWGEHILQLKEQLAALQEPPLQLYP
ncbi:MAG: serine/threonine protein kinase [gamma proteobacterium symbiont of Bathyaustriella thionipta]|nr:serine/threonine protein kinase [gamma proteobacterium symbiont of Bathyaustriella thionipta]MCU7950101.1 serine/threonine protein kinase [gamma proteobacterium symbiont of Bathyaustriella thionipta]MCU7953484.1 serine/threonine protein kinase [gamma proteobacterium symbiont of Bathyaustriella thionipta]MCU7955567.1 serine/threonine protein kinase [gamma proteobacterium symbiont of Bathyaustriella thionipta]MCU7967635.1 serine/threonine protein kinase [gamma proteobacterium symbiont of Bathy